MAWIRFNPGHIGWQTSEAVLNLSATRFGENYLSNAADPMLRLIELWYDNREEIEAALSTAPRVAPGDIVIRAPLFKPSKIIGAPANYLDHAQEMKSTRTITELGVFLKAPSSIIGPGEDIILPSDRQRADQEGELAVIIGKGGRNICRESALDHIFGYSCTLDISTRGTEDRSTRKSYDTFAPLGPALVTPDETGDVGDIRIRCWVNDDLRQDDTTKSLIFDVPRLIEYSSSVMTLEPGDVIATGTPKGVGPLAHGDRVRLAIDGVGVLEVGVRDAAAAASAHN